MLEEIVSFEDWYKRQSTSPDSFAKRYLEELKKAYIAGYQEGQCVVWQKADAALEQRKKDE